MASDGTTAARLLVDVQGRGINETAAGLGRMDSAVRGTGMGIGGLVKAAGGIYAVKTAFDATIGASIAWESAFAGVEKTVDASDAELAGLEDTLLGMSRTMPIAAGELAGIAEAAGALGIAVPDIEEFTKTVAILGATTNISTEMAATSLGQLSNVLGLTEDDYGRFAAALVDLGNKGASTEQDILAIATRMGGAGQVAGWSADQVLGWAAAVANVGIEAEAGGSSIQRFALESIKHVSAAGEELDIMAETAGMASRAFATAFGEDSSAALQLFVEGLGDLARAEQLAVLEALGFDDIRIARALLTLASGGDNLATSMSNSSAAIEEGDAHLVEYGKRADTTASKITVLGNRFADLGRRAGESQGGVLDWFIEDLDKALGEAEHFADNVGDVSFAAGIFFGDMSDQADELAAAVGMNRDEFKELANEIHATYGGSVEEVLTRTANKVRGIVPDERQTGGWSQWSHGVVAAVEAGGAEIAVAAGEAFDAIPKEEQEALAKAREEAVDGMASIMDALNDSLRDGKKGYKQSWKDFLDGQKDPFTTAQRNAFIAGQFTGSEFDDGLHSKDPEHVANTIEYVNAQLAEFNLLNPGVLAIGKDVPANLQAGMEEIMPELEQYVKDTTGETLRNLSLEEAGKLGVEGIWLYWNGMESESINATTAARNIALRSKEAMQEPDFFGGGEAKANEWARGIDSGEGYAQTQAQELAAAARRATFWEDWRGAGYNVGVAWANGLRSAGDYARLMAWELAASTNPALHGRSPPAEGPLSDIDVGGLNIGKAWAEGLGRAASYAAEQAGGLAGAANTALLGSMGGPTFGTAGAAPSGSGAVEYHTHINLTVEGNLTAKDEESVVATLQRMAGMMDMRLG